MDKKTQTVEKVGAALGMLGAFLAASGFGMIGYPFFTLSSLLLAYTAKCQKNNSLLMLQGVFLCANIIGIYTFVLR
jgi:hypothetical protein